MMRRVARGSFFLLSLLMEERKVNKAVKIIPPFMAGMFYF